MYIKFKFIEIVVVVPGCWGGLLVRALEEPQILAELPNGIIANTFIKEYVKGKDITSISCAESDHQLSDVNSKIAEEAFSQYQNSLENNEYSESNEAQIEFANEYEELKALNYQNDENLYILREYYYDAKDASVENITQALAILKFSCSKLNIGDKTDLLFVANGAAFTSNPIIRILSIILEKIKPVLVNKASTGARLSLSNDAFFSSFSSPTSVFLESKESQESSLLNTPW